MTAITLPPVSIEEMDASFQKSITELVLQKYYPSAKAERIPAAINTYDDGIYVAVALPNAMVADLVTLQTMKRVRGHLASLVECAGQIDEGRVTMWADANRNCRICHVWDLDGSRWELEVKVGSNDAR